MKETDIPSGLLCGRFLSYDFLTQAPTQKGLDNLRGWLNQHLVSEVMQKVKHRELNLMTTFNAPSWTLSEMNRMAEEHGRLISSVLKDYTEKSFQLFTAESDEKRAIIEPEIDQIRKLASDGEFQLWLEIEALDQLFRSAASFSDNCDLHPRS